ncbi:MAG TPA: hypothetical protein VK745_08660 [Polyangiaceae bacterium]|nr:hypothetical protein [Polyangiaceae bacterium]
MAPAYDGDVLRLLGRRGLEACISAFALLGFCYVPLGQHTGFEHAKAIFSTPAAKRAGGELIEAFARVRSKLTGEAVEFANGEAEPTPSSTPSAPHPEGSHPEHAHHGSEPRPRAPRLGPDSNAHEAPREGVNDANAPDASAPWHAS